ncbi:hypothetical protein RUMCAL_01632 [Ruminococcus callidus ATCC 27760]|uniref:Uncharacterized protein n=1 Tax=Ruminococcus callidus ATCC 27760 TaxID=411473 RepID=U2KAQ9_9FIRM|nr:hypothetical protein RUMCAL_01632 [Ruminococcus callidus ATCC 27760]
MFQPPKILCRHTRSPRAASCLGSGHPFFCFSLAVTVYYHTSGGIASR